MTEVEEHVHDSVRVVVTPSQASYFAGERFSVTITITNMKGPHPNQSTSNTQHKRGAHSVSYVPMARPPTSPGTRAALSAAPPRSASTGNVIVRRGIVGKPRPSKGIDDGADQSDQTRKRLLLNRSQSISVSLQDTRTEGPDDMRGKSPIRSLRVLETPMPSPTSPRISSPLARTVSVPTNHPHARKQSVADGQAQIQSPTPTPFIPNSTSTFSLTLDPIVEGSTSPMPPETPAASSPIIERAHLPPPLSSSASAPMELNNGARNDGPLQKTQVGLGRGPPPIMVQPSQTRASSSQLAAANTELILYSYAQISGTMSIDPIDDIPVTAEQLQTLQTLRRMLLNGKGVGGGSMDITSHSPQSLARGSQFSTSTRRVNHGRSTSLSSGLLSLLSAASPVVLTPTSAVPQPQSRPSLHRRSSSVLSSLFSASADSANTNGLGLGVLAPQEGEVDGDMPLPTYEVPPIMLAVDLALGPGEARSYIYELDLPSNLPPSYRGRTLRLSYEFIFGICRASESSIAGSGSHSRVMKVPIRLYNNVVMGTPPTPYDLQWPLTMRSGERHPHAEGKVTELRDSLKRYPIPNSLGRRSAQNSSIESVRLYARKLLSTTGYSDANHDMLKWLGPNADRSTYSQSEDAMLDHELSCREAVEVLTRSPKKLSYDVNKDGIKVAVLTFTKSAYRLGETILGVVELNARASRARVMKLSVVLEAHESLPTSLASPPPSASRQMRRIHAEHHSSFMTSTLRTTFSLDIPPDASPAFQVGLTPASSGKQSTLGGLEWKVRLYLLVAVASPNAREGVDGVRLKNLVADGLRGEWGTTWTAARTIAPSERPSRSSTAETSSHIPRATQSWTSFLASAFLGSSEPVNQFHDGDEGLEDEEQEGDNEEDWQEVKVEMVECEVPIQVWPGNTAFKATEVVFEV